MAVFDLFSRRLYLRIWLAVVVSVAVLTLAVGWAWRMAAEQNFLQTEAPPRPVVLRNAQGDAVGSGTAQRVPGEGLVLRVQPDGGEAFSVQMPMRQRPPGRVAGHPPGPDRGPVAFWMRPPLDFVWMLGLVGLAVAVGVYPFIRRLTQRLEALQRSVQRFGEGDLSVRVPEQGQDEVADLAHQFNAAAQRIETLVKSHKSLLANASHELRSPLTRIRMGMELMGGQQPSPAFRDEILRNIAELDQLVDEILLHSRLDAREADVGTVERVDLIGLAAEECARVGATLETTDGLQALEVQGVAKLLRRALRNLLENARRYSEGEGEGEITVTLARTGWAEMRVCDRGPGVPPDQRERIFEPFYRLPGASERHGGVGLGLALVRSIAERHQGSVHCEEHAGGGACFVLRLPLRA